MYDWKAELNKEKAEFERRISSIEVEIDKLNNQVHLSKSENDLPHLKWLKKRLIGFTGLVGRAGARSMQDYLTVEDGPNHFPSFGGYKRGKCEALYHICDLAIKEIEAFEKASMLK